MKRETTPQNLARTTFWTLWWFTALLAAYAIEAEFFGYRLFALFDFDFDRPVHYPKYHLSMEFDVIHALVSVSAFFLLFASVFLTARHRGRRLLGLLLCAISFVWSFALARF